MMNPETKAAVIGSIVGSLFSLAGVFLAHQLEFNELKEENLWTNRVQLDNYLLNRTDKLTLSQLVEIQSVLAQLERFGDADIREMSGWARKAARCIHFRTNGNSASVEEERCNSLLSDAEICLVRGETKKDDIAKNDEDSDIRVFGNCRGAINYLIENM